MRVNIGDQSEWVEKGLEKLRYEYDLSENDLVIDVGSYNGEFKSKIIEKYGCKVIEYDLLNNKGLWTSEGYIETGGAFYYTSIFEPANSRHYALDIAKEFDGLNIALCKINIEGGEYDLLDYIIEKDLLKNIKYLQVQFHTVELMNTEERYEYIKNKLSKTHELQWYYKNVWESWKRKPLNPFY